MLGLSDIRHLEGRMSEMLVGIARPTLYFATGIELGFAKY
jgi:hypothetical protein